MPVGMSNGPRTGRSQGRRGEKGEKGEWASGIEDPSSNDDGGDEDVRHVYIVPNTTLPPPYHALPTPDERRPTPEHAARGGEEWSAIERAY
jgi:hypothetical protein